MCGNGSAVVQLDTASFTFGDLVEKVVRGGLGFNAPSVQIGDVELYYHAEQADDPCPFMMCALAPERPIGAGVGHNTVLTISDETQGDLRIELTVVHVDGASASRCVSLCVTPALRRCNRAALAARALTAVAAPAPQPSLPGRDAGAVFEAEEEQRAYPDGFALNAPPLPPPAAEEDAAASAQPLAKRARRE